MKISLNKNQTLEIIKQYYKEYEGLDVKVYISTRYIDEYSVEGKITVNKELDFKGIKVNTEEELDKEDLKAIFQLFLGEAYEIDCIVFNYHMTNCTPYGSDYNFEETSIVVKNNSLRKVKKI